MRHYRQGVPKFIKGHNFSSDFNPKVDIDISVDKKSSIWEMLSADEKERRLTNLKKFKRGAEHPQWKGGRIMDDNGYIRVRSPDHPFTIDGYVLEHRLVMEEYLRKNYPNSPYLRMKNGQLYLKTEVIVHHINEIKDDNRVSSNPEENNLFPFPCEAAHIFWHHSPLTDKQKLHAIDLGIYKTKKYLKYINNKEQQ